MPMDSARPYESQRWPFHIVIGTGSKDPLN